MPDTLIRHLVLEFNDGPHVTLACTPVPVLFDQRHHAILAAAATCPACQAVQAARVVVIDAELNA